MEPNYFTSTSIHKIFRLDDRIASKQTLFNAESRGEIPQAIRIPKGKNQVRLWTAEQLPAIGARFGFLKKPSKQHVMCVYTPKGGVLKSTLTYSLARILALNGIRTIIIGLDFQCSVTDIALGKKQPESLNDVKNVELVGLYHIFEGERSVREAILKTDLPTLDIIPETSDLVWLDKELRNQTRKEYKFQQKLLPELKDYDVVIFDNAPSWSTLVENALAAATTVISPVGCDIGTFQALDKNLGHINDFGNEAQVSWDHFIVVPTLLEKAKLSQQIYGAYISQLAEATLPNPIRRAISGQESVVLSKCILEHDPTSSLAQDYYELVTAIWKRLEG